MPTSQRPNRRELQRGWPSKAPDYRNRQIEHSPADGGGTARGKRNTSARLRGVPRVRTSTREDY